MSNMSHCRFENTYKDLVDCYQHLDDDELNEYEKRYRPRLIALCKKIAEESEGV